HIQTTRMPDIPYSASAAPDGVSLPLTIKGEIGGKIVRRKECTGCAVVEIGSFVPVLKHECAFVI
uniref:hypothetical protein n=1 Tax=Rhizobium skierniewicense TaxID=984260 RepID=UPI0025712BFC